MAHELDFCIAGCRLYFVCFDKSQEMDSAKFVPGNNSPSLRGESATQHVAISGESGKLFPTLQVPEPQRADIGVRDCPTPVVCDRIPPEQVVGSAGAVKYGYDKDGKPILTKEPKLLLNDNDAGKPEGIHLVIGRRPVAAPRGSRESRREVDHRAASPCCFASGPHPYGADARG
jgi:hypothetical protein